METSYSIIPDENGLQAVKEFDVRKTPRENPVYSQTTPGLN
jgi:hypothetical protein